MKTHFIFLALLISTCAFASKEPNNTSDNPIDIKQTLLTTLLAFSVYELPTQNIQETQQSKQSEKYPQTKKQIYKPKPKKEQYNRRQQTNNRIQQYRRR